MSAAGAGEWFIWVGYFALSAHFEQVAPRQESRAVPSALHASGFPPEDRGNDKEERRLKPATTHTHVRSMCVISAGHVLAEAGSRRPLFFVVIPA